jgi:hypothetical protein
VDTNSTHLPKRRPAAIKTDFSQFSDPKKLLVALYDLPLVDFDEMWEFIGNYNTNPEIKLYWRSILLTRLAQNGEHERAFEMIGANYGSGKDKTFLIRSVFSTLNEPLEAMLTRAMAFEYKDERKAALAQLTERFYEFDVSAIQWNAIGKIDDPNLRGSVLNGFISRVKVSDSPETLSARWDEVRTTILGMQENGLVDENFAPDFCSSVAAVSPFDAWNLSVELKQKNPVSNKQLEKIASKMAAFDSERALNIVESLPESPGAMGAAFGAALEKDAKFASHWLEQNLANITSPQHDQIALASIRFSLKNGERETALKWLNLVGDNSLRIEGERMLKAKQKFKTDPSAEK